MYAKMIIIGRLGRDPETKFSPEGTPTTRFSMAVDRGYGEKKKTNWFNITFWGKAAETIQQYVKKGHLLYVEGEVDIREYTNEKTGLSVKEFTVAGKDYKLFPKKVNENMAGGQGSTPSPSRPAKPAQETFTEEPPQEDFDEEAPF